MTQENSKPIKGICVDGGTEGNPGPCFYRGVDLETGQIIFEEHLGPGTNNIAEFLGICHAVHYCEKHKLEPNIWSDSVTAIAWFRDKRHKSSFSGDVNIRLDKACEYIKNKNIKINKWLTKEWGEIPADFGRK
jgi:ribonuclease HI